MARTVLHELLAGNDAHVHSLAPDHFDDVEDGQRPPVVSVCCADSRVSQEGMWTVTEPGWLFTPSNVGNQVWDRVSGDRVVNGNVLYPVAFTGTGVVAVVGHTGCGAVTAAYRAVTGGERPDQPGIRKWVDLLVPVVEAGLDRGLDGDAPDEATVINRLVEYNVRRQATFLRDAPAVPDETDVYGFVYDFQGAYGPHRGRAYLVDLAGETDPSRIRAALGEPHRGAVGSLLDADGAGRD